MVGEGCQRERAGVAEHDDSLRLLTTDLTPLGGRLGDCPEAQGRPGAHTRGQVFDFSIVAMKLGTLWLAFSSSGGITVCKPRNGTPLAFV